jgi:hypothetical protein
LLILGTPVLAADEDPKPSGPAIQTGASLALANQLAAYGDANKDPLALVAAAKILKQIGEPRALQGEPKSEGSGSGGKENPASDGNSAADLLARAEALAGQNADLRELIADVRATGSRGAADGAGCYDPEVVRAGYHDNWDITFTPGSNYVQIAGDGDTDLDLEIYSGDGRLICESVSYSDRESCQWYQRGTGRIRAVVTNLGGVWNEYRLCTN